MTDQEKKELKKQIDVEIKEGIKKMLIEAEFIKNNNQKKGSDSK
jgi:hypothetical protein